VSDDSYIKCWTNITLGCHSLQSVGNDMRQTNIDRRRSWQNRKPTGQEVFIPLSVAEGGVEYCTMLGMVEWGC
jgi:hypothetical protein